MSTQAYEVNFDGLVGPTHNYAGLALGNIAAGENVGRVSHPKAAALQGLAKMKQLADLGVKQAVLPPHDRPDVGALRRLGFAGGDADVLAAAAREAPGLLAACASASSMWAANAATVSPSADCADGLAHFTAANLAHHLHRSLEVPMTAHVLRTIFNDDAVFAHHDPLPAAPQMGDEGAANHTRLCAQQGEAGIELFVYGDSEGRFPRRQKRAASRTVARLHGLDPNRTFLARQQPAAIDAGVFHNDVIAVGHRHVLLYHALAFAKSDAVIDRLHGALADHCDTELIAIEITADQLTVEEAVRTYLFNSQLVSTAGNEMVLVCPAECEQSVAASRVLDEIVAGGNPIARVVYVDTRQSMQNGGGPACLRLRVVLTDDQLKRIHQPVLLTDDLHACLVGWVEKHYRDELAPADLSDPALLDQSRAALEELTQLLQLGSLYPFQRGGSG